MRFFIVGLCNFIVVFCSSQEQYGITFSNYTPTNSVFINPSSMLDAKTWLDIKIVGAGAYLNNNGVSLDNTSFYRLYKTEGEGIDENDISFHYGKRKYHVYNRNFVNVLSGVWSQGDHAAGLFFNARSFSMVRNIPESFVKFAENGIPNFEEQHQIDYQIQNLNASSIHFGEIQLSYAYTFLKKRRNMFMGGISLKKMIGGVGGALNGYNFEFNVRDSIQLSIFELQADASVANDYSLGFKSGTGIDLGFTFQRMLGECTTYYPNSKKMGCNSLPYKYKLAASLMDIGSLRLEEDKVSFAGYDFSSFEWFNYDSLTVDENNATEIFAAQESSISSGKVKKPYKFRLPSYISLQADYNLWASKLYASAAIIQALPISKNKFGVRRANSLCAAIRFETKIVEVSVPISLYEYTRPQLGLALRLYCVTIGTDKLLHIFGRNDLYGGDIYFHINVPIFYNPKCKERLKKYGKGSQNGYKIYKNTKKGCEAYD